MAKLKINRIKVTLSSLFCCLFIFTKAQNIPIIGNENELEIACWNLEWFGNTKAGYGPENDTLQQNYIFNILNKTQIDIWALSEISDTNAFKKMMLKIPRFNYSISNYGAEQKTSIIYLKSDFEWISSRLLGTENKDSFSSGRYPLELTLKSLKNNGIDTLTLIALHLKSNIGSDSLKMLAYNSRKRSSEWLNWYLSTYHKNHFCAVLGDWNDDLDISIFNKLPSPFSNLIFNNYKYSFTSKALTNKGLSSTTSYPEMIDHQLFSSQMMQFFMKDSIMILRADNWIPNYALLVSDHYPVLSKFSPKSTRIVNKSISEIKIIPNPNQGLFKIQTDENYTIEIFDYQGVKVHFQNCNSDTIIDINFIENGLYFLAINFENSIKYLTLSINK